MDRDKKSHEGKDYGSHYSHRRERVRSPVSLFDPQVYVLDFLPQGRGIGSSRRDPLHPLIYALGIKYFSLLEIHFRDITISVNPQDLLNLETHKTEIIRIRQLDYDELSTEAKLEIPEVIDKIVEEDEQRFVDFFNNAQPITNRLHQLRLLPGIGEARMWDILEARKKATFKNYQDLRERAKINPKRLIATRVLEEFERDEKHLLFVRKKRERSDDSSSRRPF